ncbi:hypothetical protein SELMODRAFT_410704 [Selaginella moellendorffii]|uniref:Uncharacterized protein n=1 Tax=Selaginella moellendorffii TaxID=88036 RepID=D8RFK8_SELML|nr:hypothetical protein SELMODRAFT_410704 [Selaginella moellendorffii]
MVESIGKSQLDHLNISYESRIRSSFAYECLKTLKMEFLLLKDILEIKDEEKKLVVHTALHKSEEVIEKQAHFCLSDTAISHKNNAWDANSEDSQDYNSGSESEDNTKNSIVFTINTKDARAQTHARATPHEPHEGFKLHHLSISAAGVAEGSD